MGVVPAGRITYEKNFAADNFFIRKMTPPERLEKIENGSQKIVGQPVYFSLYTPRTFDTAEISFRFRNRTDFRVIEAGILADKKIWRYQTRPLENKVLDALARSWYMIEASESILLQRVKKYDSIEAFRSNPPDLSKVAAYNVDFNPPFSLPGYIPNENLAPAGIGRLRGDYQFYTYVKSEGLYFRFKLHDLNENTDRDDVEIRLFNGGTEVRRVGLPDDGNLSDDGRAGGQRESELIVPDLAEGAYKVEFRAGSDIVTDQITTIQKKIVFMNRLWLLDEGPAGVLCTDSYQLTAQTADPASLQTIYIRRPSTEKSSWTKELEIAETYRQYSLSTDDRLKTLAWQEGDLIMSGDGLFSPDCEAFFRPVPKKLPAAWQEQDGGLDYIIADYHPPKLSADGWSEASAVFDLKNAYRENGKYSFMLSAPGLLDVDGKQDYIEISNIKADLTGSDIANKLKRLFSL